MLTAVNHETTDRRSIFVRTESSHRHQDQRSYTLVILGHAVPSIGSSISLFNVPPEARARADKFVRHFLSFDRNNLANSADDDDDEKRKWRHRWTTKRRRKYAGHVRWQKPTELEWSSRVFRWSRTERYRFRYTECACAVPRQRRPKTTLRFSLFSTSFSPWSFLPPLDFPAALAASRW